MIVSVDLAYKRAEDVGVVVLDRLADGSSIACRRARLASHEFTPLTIARQLDQIAVDVDAKIIVLDGPQAWKATDNGLEHSRVCERRLNTPAKTGLPGAVKPRNYTPFVEFSVAVYDALETRGWQRLAATEEPVNGRVLIESFPFSAWRSLGLSPLSAKRKTRPLHLTARWRELATFAGLTANFAPTHDELQAIVSGLAGVAVEANEWSRCASVGVAPHLVDGTWREGFIVNPRAVRDGS